MKLVYVLPLLLIGLLPVAFGEIESVETTVYPGVDVDIFGKVTSTGDWDRVILQIFGPDGNMVVDDALLVGPKGDFRSKYEADKLVGFGEYQIKIFHLEYSKITTFNFKPMTEDMEVEDQVICVEGDIIGPNGYCIPKTPTPDDSDSILRTQIVELENRVQELENEKSTLEKANEELQIQVDFLQEQLDNISKQFTDSVSQLNEWFVTQLDR